MAKRFGKEPHEWLRLPETIAYMDALAKSGIFPELVRTKRGRSGGTWLHSKLAVAFARWLSPDFAIWCDLQIDALIHGEMPIKQQFDQACKMLEDGRQLASLHGRGLAEWKFKKPGLEHRVDEMRDRLQMVLGLDAA
ncbi:ORF11CD3 domain protein [compost metagenome]